MWEKIKYTAAKTVDMLLMALQATVVIAAIIFCGRVIIFLITGQPVF